MQLLIVRFEGTPSTPSQFTINDFFSALFSGINEYDVVLIHSDRHLLLQAQDLVIHTDVQELE